MCGLIVQGRFDDGPDTSGKTATGDIIADRAWPDAKQCLKRMTTPQLVNDRLNIHVI
jgi:hypothetical protein